MSTKNAQRLSQLISTFGPGAMMDLPTRSVVVGGLDLWDIGGDTSRIISEERLARRLEKILKSQHRFPPDAYLTLRTPPVSGDGRDAYLRGVTTPIFPAWFVCELTESTQTGAAPSRRRRLVPWDDLDPKGRRRFHFDDGRKSNVNPIRFVCACDRGHLQDIDWRWAIHGQGDNCRQAMWVEEKGTSADPADTSIVCACGKRLSLQETFLKGRLGKCRGERPWLLDRDPDGCGEDLKLLTRTATNTYFAQVYTVISLPSGDDDLTRLVEEVIGHLAPVTDEAGVAAAKLFNPTVKATLGPYSDHDIIERLQRIREGGRTSASRTPKIAEFDVFASGRAEIGHNDPKALLYAQTLPREVWTEGAAGLDLSAIKSLVAVHRLREVSCLYGFTRFEAAPTSADGTADFEDVELAVRGAPLSRDADWLPAIEQFGEGLFVHFDEAATIAWLSQALVIDRHRKLAAGYDHWKRRFSGKPPPYPGTAYTLLHGISHALMAEIALDCGYPTSSLKERVYALAGSNPQTIGRCGILIYTATAGAQGTLGGLVGSAPRFAQMLRNALERQRICSSDPVCADHEPDGRSGDRATHGAACHSCLLIAETSCEMRNLFLDRRLLVETMGGGGAQFFSQT